MTFSWMQAIFNAGLLAGRPLAACRRSPPNEMELQSTKAGNTMPMNKTPKSGANVVQLPLKSGASRQALRRAAAAAERGTLIDAGSPDDPRMQQALRMAKAFLAIEDATARGALVDLAERMADRDCALRL